MENGEANLQGMQGAYSIAFEANVDGAEMEVDTKPKVEKKGARRKKKGAETDSDEEVLDNKLEDNPTQVSKNEC